MRPDFVAMANDTNTNKRASRQFHMSELLDGMYCSPRGLRKGEWSAAVRVCNLCRPSLANGHLRSL
jgi:hypothetical protein